MAQKFIYKFEKIKTIPVETKTKNEAGEEIIVKETKDVVHTYALKSPSRTQRDDSEVFFNTTFGVALKKGMLSRASMAKITFDEGTIFTKPEQENLDKLKDKLLKIQEEYTLIKLKKDEELTEEDKTRLSQINVEFFDLTSELQKYEAAQENLFNNTADTYAFNRYLIWYLLNISGKLNDKDEFTPLFSGKTYEEKVAEHDNILEGDDEFLKEVIRELTFLVTYWVRGKANTQDDFDRILKAVRDNI